MDRNAIVILLACALAVAGVIVVKRLMLKPGRPQGQRFLLMAALAAGIMTVMSILLSLLQ